MTDAPELTSTRSPRVQAVRRLHRRSARLAERRFVVEGPGAVRAGLDHLQELFVAGGHPELVTAARARGIPMTTVAPAVLAAMSETVTPQGVLGVATLLDVPLAALPERPRLVVVLVAANDPGNAGTVLRTADAAGADAVVLTEGSVDPHAGKCVRASAGSLFHLPVVHGARLPDALAALRERGLQVLATTGAGQHELDDLQRAGGLAAPTAWLLGTEAHGLAPAALAEADRTVRIAQYGRAESLNLAVAAGLCLYASARSQRVAT